ncbi:MAG: alpha/beta hydrolase [Candidatus Electrothrix sp. GM3_4]|nr:alpha/beta hydrolase [Candidatus Electrothrix sp. GM3_4]
MQIILLPGMDGTGILFRPFIEELAENISEDIFIQVISYPCDQKLSYGQLIEYVRSRLPVLPMQEEIILVAESFSGPIGYALAAEQPNIRAVIFVATFLSPPEGLVWMMPPSLMTLFMRIPLPLPLLKLLFFDQGTANETVTLFRSALKKVKCPVLTSRMREITGLRIKTQGLNIPCAYIQAGNDRLISRSHVEEFRRIASQIEVTKIPGPHLIMQTRPRECAQVVGKYIEVFLVASFVALLHPLSLFI